MSRPAKMLLVMGAILLVLAATGVLQASRGNEITKEEAVEIARGEVDFEAEDLAVRFLRSGASLQPTWIVSLSTFAEDGSRERLSVVQVDAATGEVITVANER